MFGYLRSREDEEMAGEEVLIGIVIGGFLVAALNPARGFLFIMLQQRRQIEMLLAKNGNGQAEEEPKT